MNVVSASELVQNKLKLNKTAQNRLMTYSVKQFGIGQ